MERLKALDADLAKYLQDLTNKKSECQSLDDSVSSKQREIIARQNELEANNAARPGAVIDIDNKNGVVDDLRKNFSKLRKI